MCYYDEVHCHNFKIRDSKMNWLCLTQGNCLHIGIQKSEGLEFLLDIGRDGRKNYKFCLKENEY